ncbi:hypothetical protein LNP17_20065 [Klebsiella variicola subsp. variicola]|nr:hypothetical protein [Klebsiella variicola subsp. variicola]
MQNISPQGSCCEPRLAPEWGQTLIFIARSRLLSMPYGQAMAILCLTEYLRKYF